MIDAVIDRFGLTRMPFGRDLPPGRLHRHADCAEAAARITWAVAGRTIGVITGEVGTGKTAAVRAAVAVSGTWIFISDARASAAALARDLELAQQQLAAVHGGGAPGQAQDAAEGAF